MVIGALVGLLGTPDASVDALTAAEPLPAIRQPFQSGALFARIGKVLINSAGEATVLIGRLPDVTAERREAIAACLWRLVADNVIALRCNDHFNLMLDNLYALEICVSGTRRTHFCCYRVMTFAPPPQSIRPCKTLP